jgi:Type III restriction enzyme, res subunit
MRVPCAEFGAGVVRAKGQDAVRLRLGGRHELKANRVADSDDDVRGTGGSSSGARPGSNAINAAIEAIAKRQNRILLVMATGTGKTYTAFQII